MNTTTPAPTDSYPAYHVSECAARFRYAFKQVAHTAHLVECAERLLAEARKKHARAISTAQFTRYKLATAAPAHPALLAASN